MSNTTSVHIDPPEPPRRHRLVCTARDQHGQDITSRLVWESADPSLLEPCNSWPGAFRLLGEGFTTIRAYVRTQPTLADRIAVGIPWITKIRIAPRNESVIFSSSCHAPFTARDQLGREVTSLVTWGSTNPLIASCDDRDPGVFHVEDIGRTQIFAYYLRHWLTSDSTVLAVQPNGIVIVPAHGQEMEFFPGQTLAFRAIDLDGRDITSLLTWGAINQEMLDAEQNQPGVFTVWAAGQTRIFAFFGPPHELVAHADVKILPARTTLDHQNQIFMDRTGT